MATNFRQEGKRIAYTATAAKTSGQVVVIGEAIGVCLANIAKDAIGSVALEGVWNLPKANEVLAQGMPIFTSTWVAVAPAAAKVMPAGTLPAAVAVMQPEPATPP